MATEHVCTVIVLIAGLALVSAAPSKRDIDATCTCQAGLNIYTVVPDGDCTTFKQYLDPDNVPVSANQQCPSGTKFDVSICVCNHAVLVSCPDSCDAGGGGGGGGGGGDGGSGMNGECDSGYSLNPIADTCLRFVKTKLDWAAADAACTAAGETLLVLDTVDSIEWFRNLRATNSTWRRFNIWVAARSVGGVGLAPFKWYGRLAGDNGEGTQLLFADWEDVQPNFNGECVSVQDDRRSDPAEPLKANYKWNDAPCDSPKYYVCEKPAS